MVESDEDGRRVNQCDRCGAALDGGVLDQQHGESVHMCGWMCWAKWRFGAGLSDKEAAHKALEYDIERKQALEYLEYHMQNNDDE